MKYFKSASIILERNNGNVLLCRRNTNLRAFPDMWVFPGGKIDDELQEDWNGDEWVVIENLLREMYEEIGIVPGVKRTFKQNERSDNIRAINYDDDIRNDFLDNLIFIGRKRTPPFLNRGFDAAYFHIKHQMIDQFEIIVDGEELVEYKWIKPADAIEQWKNGEILLPPPILHLLRTLNEQYDNLQLLTLIETELPIGLQTKVDFTPQLSVIPFESNTIQPFISTNHVLIHGKDTMCLIDPGAKNVEHLIQVIQSYNKPVKFVIITHYHKDHWEAVDKLLEQYPTIKVLAHKDTISMIEINAEAINNELISEYSLRVIDTPGHCRGHICLYHEEEHAIIAGDHVVGVGSAVLDPSNGNMTEYMDSTKKLLKFNARIMIPAHGPMIFDVKKKLNDYLEHRINRENAVLNAIHAGDNSLDEIVQRVYVDVSKEMWEYAKRNIKLHIDKLLLDEKITHFPM